MYLGLPTTTGGSTASYTDAMGTGKQELVLISCLEGVKGCDFSPAMPHA